MEVPSKEASALKRKDWLWQYGTKFLSLGSAKYFYKEQILSILPPYPGFNQILCSDELF